MSDDHRIDAVVDRLSQEFVDDAGNSADPAAVAEVVHAAASELQDAPVQDFVPLIVENEARDVLHEQGLHRSLPDDPTGQPTT